MKKKDLLSGTIITTSKGCEYIVLKDSYVDDGPIAIDIKTGEWIDFSARRYDNDVIGTYNGEFMTAGNKIVRVEKPVCPFGICYGSDSRKVLWEVCKEHFEADTSKSFKMYEIKTGTIFSYKNSLYVKTFEDEDMDKIEVPYLQSLSLDDFNFVEMERNTDVFVQHNVSIECGAHINTAMAKDIPIGCLAVDREGRKLLKVKVKKENLLMSFEKKGFRMYTYDYPLNYFDFKLVKN